MSARDNLALRIRQAFLDLGYERVTMGELAEAIGISRRALYHHFPNKEEMFRYILWQDNREVMQQSFDAGQAALNNGASAADVVAEIMDVRFGTSRRRLNTSPHGKEINDQAYRLAHEMMIEVAVYFQKTLAELIVEMERRQLLQLRPDTSPEDLAQLLSDGARGINLMRPSMDIEKLRQRYQKMCIAILFGCADSVSR